MSEYGSVRQYRNRVTRGYNAGEKAPFAVTCRSCSGAEHSCDECLVITWNEWVNDISDLLPPPLQGVPVSKTHAIRDLVR